MKIIPRPEHNISRKNIDPDALKVLYRLRTKGFKAYLVGGGVRDLLLGQRPKDFDISTDAHPNQIKKAFRNCFLIGRRFRLAHIRFGQKIIEVSTFRKQVVEGDNIDTSPERDLLIRRDNTFGTPEEDAFRRDFTINALFYDIADFSVIDYVGGMEDLEKKRIRLIGEPEVRYREDPVRMLRAIRLSTRLGLQIEEKTWEGILEWKEEIRKSPPSRLMEEFYRILEQGSAEPSLRLLDRSGLLEIMAPNLAKELKASYGNWETLDRFLAVLDEWKENPDRDRAVCLAALLAPFLPTEMLRPGERGESLPPDIGKAASDRIQYLTQGMPFPRGDRARVHHMFVVQRRYHRARNNRPSWRRLKSKSYFRDVDTFAKLLERAHGGT